LNPKAAFASRYAIGQGLVTLGLIAELGLGAAAGAATDVTLQGMLGHKALLLIGGNLRTLGPGESAGGVKVLSTVGNQAVLEVDGMRYAMRVGDTPASVGGAADADGGGDQIILTADTSGSFTSQGSINGKSTRFLVDTGATLVSIGQPEADRLGLHYQTGQRLVSHTANGTTAGWFLKLPRLSIGSVTVYDVDAMVLPAAMPIVLLGNSFLSRFRMQRDADRLVLIKQ
jgi:aspartyl protease family protein